MATPLEDCAICGNAHNENCCVSVGAECLEQRRKDAVELARASERLLGILGSEEQRQILVTILDCSTRILKHKEQP